MNLGFIFFKKISTLKKSSGLSTESSMNQSSDVNNSRIVGFAMHSIIKEKNFDKTEVILIDMSQIFNTVNECPKCLIGDSFSDV